MKNNNQGFALIAVLMVIIIALGVGLAYVTLKNKSESSPSPSPTLTHFTSTPTSTASTNTFPVTTPTPDVTQNWKLYTNTQYGFQFKYPASWKFNNSAPAGVPTIQFNSNGIGVMEVSLIPDVVDNFYGSNFTFQTNITIGGQNAMSYQSNDEFNMTGFLIKSKKMAITFYDQDNLEIKAIRDSFKFTSTQSQVYENQYMKVSIPTGWSYGATQNGAINITKNNYVLYINPNTGGSVGPVDDLSGLTNGSPSGDLVLKTEPYRGVTCGDFAQSNVTSKLARFDGYINNNGRKVEGGRVLCDAPATDNIVWYFSYITTVNDKDNWIYIGNRCYMNGIDSSTEACQSKTFAITMSYKTNMINNLPSEGSSELQRMLGEMTNIAKSVQFK